MKYAVIDIGSNSVRLLISQKGITSDKIVITTRLAEGMSDDMCLTTVAMQRTVAALSFLCEKAKNENVNELFVFATAAVRNAKNRQDFLELAYNSCGVIVDVLSGEDEGKVGYLGALDGIDGGLIDVGGASSEIIVTQNNLPIYVKSLNIGAVSVQDICGQNEKTVDEYVEKRIAEYGQVPVKRFTAIGGTATSIAAMLLQLDEYDAKKVDGFKVCKTEVLALKNKLFSLDIEQRKSIKGLQPERAKIIPMGVAIICKIMDYLQVDEIIVSEKDNLEGYLKLKVEQ